MTLCRRLLTVPLMLCVNRNVRLRSLVVEKHQTAKTTTNRPNACVFAQKMGRRGIKLRVRGISHPPLVSSSPLRVRVRGKFVERIRLNAFAPN